MNTEQSFYYKYVYCFSFDWPHNLLHLSHDLPQSDPRLTLVLLHCADENLLYSHDDWQYPSPTSTPRSNKHVIFPFSDLSDDQASQTLLDSCRPNPQLPKQAEQPYTHGQTQARPDIKSKTHDGRPLTGVKWNPKAFVSSARPKHSQEPAHGMTQSQHNPTLTHSFLEQFDGTSLQEPFVSWPPMDSTAENMSQMQTPPPTRDTSTKRKPHQPPITFNTPSTIKSRRQSVPTNDWLKRSVDQTPLDSSPLSFNAPAYSPPNIQHFPGDAPFTAPAYPQSNIFWGQDSQNDADAMTFSTQANTSFTSPPERSLFASSNQWPSAKASSNTSNTRSISALDVNSGQVSLTKASRSQHADPTTAVASDTAYEQLSMSGVDPSVLFSRQAADIRQLAMPEAPVERSVQQISPYQYHVDELKRQKEQQRRMKSTSRRFQGSIGGASTSGDVAPSLRRSLTDSRSRRSVLQSSFSDPVDHEGDLALSGIPRHSSPLKRLRTNSVISGRERDNSSPRKSVVLAVDESGRARTVVQTIADPTRRPSHISTANNDGDSDTEDQHQTAGGKLEMQMPGRQDAQEALRAMRRERQQRSSHGKLNSSVVPPIISARDVTILKPH